MSGKDRARQVTVWHNPDGSPIVKANPDGLARNAVKRKTKELLKTFTKKQVWEMKQKAKAEAKKLFDAKMKKADAEVREEMKKEDQEIADAKARTKNVASPQPDNGPVLDSN